MRPGRAPAARGGAVPRCAQADREAFLNVRKLCTATERRKRTSGGDKSARRIGERCDGRCDGSYQLNI